MNVGQLVANRKPALEFLSRMSRLLAADDVIDDFARVTRDTRLNREQWRSALQAELNLLTRWAARRLVDMPPRQAGSLEFTNVLSLLPGYGFALHILRRAAPFAVLGIPTTISVRPDLIEPADVSLEEIGSRLGLKDLLTVSDEKPTALVARFTEAGDPIVLTGKRDTFLFLRQTYPNARIFAATGCCLVVIGTRSADVDAVAAVLERKRLIPSCSNLGLALTIKRSHDLEREIIRAHPTMILRVDTNAGGEAPTVAGYRVIDCDIHGIPHELDAAAKDPIGGWPGDYVL